MEVTKAKVANALTSAAKDHVIAVAADVFDEELQQYQSEINKGLASGSADSDCVLDLGVVASADVAFERAGEPEVVNNPKIRIIQWRTSDSTNDGGRGAGGTIFQERHGNWYVVQWSMFFGSLRQCRVRCVTTGGRHTVGAWQDLILPTAVAYEAATRQITATGVQPGVNGEAAKVTTLLTLPTATTSQAGLMAAADKSKLNSLPTATTLEQSLAGKVNAVSGKGLSTHDFDTEQLEKLSNTGLYGRKSGLKYGVRNLYALTADSTDAEIREALTSSDGQRLLETDLTYCAENGCCLLDETTNGHVMVNKATDGTMYNLIEISIPKIGAPGVTSFEIPSMRVITLLSKADEDIPQSQWAPENMIWSCKRVFQEKIAYKSNLDTKLDKIKNCIYTHEMGGDGITIFYNVQNGVAQPLTMVSPAGVVAFKGSAIIGKNVLLPDGFNGSEVARRLFIDIWNSFAKLNDACYDPENAPDADHPFYANEIWMTYEEALAVYEYGKSNFTLPQQLAVQGLPNTHYHIRTNLLMPMCSDGMRAANMIKTAYSADSLETIRVSQYSEIDTDSNYSGITALDSLLNFCRGCTKLRKILGVVYLDRLSASSSVNYAYVFERCLQLEEFTFIRLKTNLGINGAPKISQQSMQTLVDYAINTTPITISVHPDVYAKLTGDVSNPAAAALGIKETAQWATLLQTAAAKNIQFTDTPL